MEWRLWQQQSALLWDTRANLPPALSLSNTHTHTHITNLWKKKNRSASYLTLFHDSLCRKRIFYFKIFRTLWNCSYQLLPVSCISFLQVTNAHRSYVFLYLFIDRRSSFLNKIISLDSAALRKLLNVKIIDDEEYEKNKTFTIVLEEPILLEVGQKHGKWHSSSSSSTAIGLIYLFNCFTNDFCLQTCVCVCVPCRRH